MSVDAIQRAYAQIGNHRTVAERFNLRIHYVMWAVGLMGDDLYRQIERGR